MTGARALAAIVLSLAVASMSFAQDPSNPDDDDAEEASVQRPSRSPASGDDRDDRRSFRPWNGFESKWVNGLLFGGMALDFVRYAQSTASREQIGDLTDYEVPEIRVMRLGIAGTFNFQRPWRWYVSGAYRGFDEGFDRSQDDAWSLFDVWLEIPLGRVGWVTLGKFKEPLSMERLMGGGMMPGIERAMGTDALTPSRNVGVQLGGYLAHARATWAAGVFNDWAFTGEPFDRAASQVIARVTGLPMNSPDGAGLLHLGASGRYSDVKPGVLRFKATPEVFSFPSVLDTDEFSAESMTHGLVEAYYQRGPLWLGSEVLYASVDSPKHGDPLFRSAWFQASWIINGHSRRYVPQRGIFGVPQPVNGVTSDGRGLLEVGARYSTLDLEDGAIHGGESSRFTGIVNWYLTRRSLLAFNYGLIQMNRDGPRTKTHAFQMRLFLLF